jgi:hypothetical protein
VKIERSCALTKLCRPIGVVGGSVNKSNQTAAEIVGEIVKETVATLKGANGFLNSAAKL